MRNLELVILNMSYMEETRSFLPCDLPPYIVRIEKINVLMINSRRSQIMVTILLNSGEVLLPGDILDKVQHPQGNWGGGGVGLGGEIEGRDRRK